MNISSKVNNLDGLKRSLSVTVNKDEYISEFKKGLGKYKASAKIDGFRAGKVPENIIMKNYKDRIHGDAMNSLIENSLTESLAENKLDTLRTSIVSGNISFAEAARKYSDEKETRNNGGQLVNPTNFDTRFDLTKMDPTLSAQVYNLKEGEVSKVFTERDRTGRSTFKVLSVTKKIEEHPADYAKDYEKIQQLALKQKQIRAIELWQKEKIKETYVNVNEDYRDCEYASNWVKK